MIIKVGNNTNAKRGYAMKNEEELKNIRVMYPSVSPEELQLAISRFELEKENLWKTVAIGMCGCRDATPAQSIGRKLEILAVDENGEGVDEITDTITGVHSFMYDGPGSLAIHLQLTIGWVLLCEGYAEKSDCGHVIYTTNEGFDHEFVNCKVTFI